MSKIYLSVYEIVKVVPTLIFFLISHLMPKLLLALGGKKNTFFFFFANQGILALTKHSVALKAWQKTAYNVSLCRIIKDFTV